MKATILLAEDEQAMREVLTDYFTAKSGGDFTVVSAPDGDTALHLIETRRFDLLLLDIMLPKQYQSGRVCGKESKKFTGDRAFVPYFIRAEVSGLLLPWNRKGP